MTAIGTLVGTGILPIGSTFAWAICGAFSGDWLSYWFGKRYHQHIRGFWPFKHHPGWIAAGEAFFQRHGGKSVIIGRFIGPMRSTVPMFAGVLKMPQLKFLRVAIVSAIGWAIVYMLPGILLGKLSLELPPHLAAKFILWTIGLIIATWGIVLTARFLTRKLHPRMQQGIQALWHWLQRHSSTRWTLSLLCNPKEEADYRQLSRFIWTALLLVAFLVVLLSVRTHGVLTHFNQPLHALFVSLRNPLTDKIMVAFTLLGNRYVEWGFAFGVLLYWLFQRHWRLGAYWAGLVLVASGSIEFFKHLVHSPRPGGIAHPPLSSSFPSGHVCLTLSLLGFLTVVIIPSLSAIGRRRLYYAVSGVITLIVSSRLYLGAHWLSDILGSLFLGLFWVNAFNLAYRRTPSTRPLMTRLLPIAAIWLCTVWAVYGTLHFTTTLSNYHPIPPRPMLAVIASVNHVSYDAFQPQNLASL